MSANPYESPESPSEPAKPATGRRGFRLIELLLVVGLIGLLIACLLPMRRGSTQAARRMSCQNNLRQIALALHNYEDEFGCLPPAYTVDASGKPLHSWRTLILPYAEQKPLYDKIDLSKPWDDPANKVAFETHLPMYQCPANRVDKGHTTYLAVVCAGGCFLPTESRKLAEIIDDPSRTLMIIEVPADRAVPWMSPRDATEPIVVNALTSKRPAHSGGTQAAMADARVFYLETDTKPETLRALITIAGNDDAAAKEAE
jgi:type II secretory pathway pseudopilin PulG